ncbi:hypothetical protein [Paracidovorax citrulli]|uniref:hypothetical protein n=1 Tax=Paracidovorax citrulli TaxID=80869 RepID=UPI000ACD474C|nr:hypothetical protein [Paracidovorax citrulli]
MDQETHPGSAALAAYAQHAHAKNMAREQKMSAAALRKQAKTEKLQVDAFALRKKAKDLTAKSRQHAASANATRKEMLEHAAQALEQLTTRMPPEYQAWGSTKTHIYAALLKTLESQVARVNPALAVIAEALQLLLTHRDWTEKTLTRLSGARAKSWPVPAAE